MTGEGCAVNKPVCYSIAGCNIKERNMGGLGGETNLPLILFKASIGG